MTLLRAIHFLTESFLVMHYKIAILQWFRWALSFGRLKIESKGNWKTLLRKIAVPFSFVIHITSLHFTCLLTILYMYVSHVNHIVIIIIVLCWISEQNALVKCTFTDGGFSNQRIRQNSIRARVTCSMATYTHFKALQTNVSLHEPISMTFKWVLYLVTHNAAAYMMSKTM